MKNESVGRRHEGWRALWFAIAGVMAVMLAWNVLMLSLNGISIDLQTGPPNHSGRLFALSAQAYRQGVALASILLPMRLRPQ